MATSLQVKRGVTAKVAAYTPLEGELVLDLTTKKLYVGDGSTAGGNQIVASRKGVTDASAAATGEIGEVITVTGSSTSATSGTILDVTSITLTPGDWDVSGTIRFDTSTAAFTNLTGSFNTVSATLNTFPYAVQLNASFSAGNQQLPVPMVRFNVSVNTVIYLNTICQFSSGTVTSRGYIFARRAR